MTLKKLQKTVKLHHYPDSERNLNRIFYGQLQNINGEKQNPSAWHSPMRMNSQKLFLPISKNPMPYLKHIHWVVYEEDAIRLAILILLLQQISRKRSSIILTHIPILRRIIERGDRTSSILVSSGKQIDLMVQPPDGFGSLLQHFTWQQSTQCAFTGICPLKRALSVRFWHKEKRR